MNNNAINTGELASSGEAIAGTDARKLITPATLAAVLDQFSPPELYVNLGVSYSAGVFSVTGANGSALSAGSPANVYISSKASPGLVINYLVDAVNSFDESDLDGNLFGTDSGVAWNEDKPFYIYAVHNDAEDDAVFMISAIPSRTTSPASANISKAGSTAASTQGSFFALRNITVTDYDNNNCVLVGSFRMRKNSSDEWTVQALDLRDGIGLYQQLRSFNFPTGQFGANTSQYLIDNGGTAPVFSSQSYRYYIDKDGFCQIVFVLSGDGGTDGSGAVNLQMVVPFANGGSDYQCNLEVLIDTTREDSVLNFVSANYFEIFRSSNDAKLQYTSFINADRSINGWTTYLVDND
jgi:hypothetical protein